MFSKGFIVTFFFLLFFGIFGFQKAQTIANQDQVLYAIEKKAWIDSVSNTLSLEEKIAQFFMVAAYTNKDATHQKHINDLVTKTKVGGIIFFKGHPTVQAQWVNQLQAKAEVPLMISIDGEWGINMRLDSTIKYPRQLTLGAIQNNELIYEMGKRIAQECKAVGVNINLAPVIDVNNNPNNPVINDRSFGEDKYNVALKGLAYMQGMQDQKVMAVGKHFPGHGDTDADSHKTLPIIKHNKQRLENIEFYPFKALFANGLQGVMAAHLHIPALDNSSNRAVSLSKKVTTHLLRDSLGFKGLVFSDALNMKGVSNFFAPGEVDKEAFLAGNDILLFSEDVNKGIALIKKAVKTKEISVEYINQRLAKVLAYKYELGLHKTKPIATQNIPTYLQNKEAKAIQKQLFEKAITLVNNEEQLVPLTQSFSTASLTLGQNTVSPCLKTLAEYTDIKHFTPKNKHLAKWENYQQVIIAVNGMSRYASKNYGFSQEELQSIQQINQKTKVLLVLFGSPYSLVHFKDYKNIVVAYENNAITQQAVANILLGNLSVEGKLPVSAGGFKAGEGFFLSIKNALQYAKPQAVGVDTFSLQKIDSIMQSAIENKATPGGQILAAKDGKIFYNKAFGHFEYGKNAKEVSRNSIYDVASITKVAATTLAIMRLYEQGKINLDKTISDYLPEFDTTNIADISIQSMLVHQSGLPGWIPFYTRTTPDSVFGLWYQARPNEEFCIPVADSMYMCADSTGIIWDIIGNQEPKINPKYRYSDIGFYLLKEMIERITKQKLDKYVMQEFYEPLGLKRTGYLPLERFAKENIVPSEDDQYFRKQKIQGYVHDMGAAMLGGVSGHAGIFSTASDLAVILQMLLNDGVYKGKQYFKPETIQYFTSRKVEDNRRGLGFDKPVLERDGKGPTSDLCSLETYGHSGFTGCVMWADPTYDLIYIFLSNRTFPTMENKKLIRYNVRTDIQDLLYNSIGIVDSLMVR